MTKKELIKRLEVISGELDMLPGESSLVSAAKDIKHVMDKLDEVIQEIEDDSVDNE